MTKPASMHGGTLRYASKLHRQKLRKCDIRMARGFVEALAKEDREEPKPVQGW
jgi:hypothetical protein